MPKAMYDAAQGLAFLVSQLAAIESKIYSVMYQHITYPQIIPVSMEAGEFATSVDYFFMDGAGVARFVGSKSLDVPVSDFGLNKVTVPVELAATGYEFSDEELRQATHLRVALPQNKANMSRRASEEHIQRVFMTGDTAHALPGFINNTNVAASTVADPGSGTTWAVKTSDQILTDINTLFASIFNDSKMVERANKLLLPPAQWSVIASTPRAVGTDTTILQYIINTSPYLNSLDDVLPMNELTGAGAGSTDRMMAYTKDVDKVVAHMPMPLRYTEPQRHGRGFQVPGEYKVSGVEFRYPGSAEYADGI